MSSALASGALDDKASEIIARYPEKRSAVLPLLHLVQETFGWISDEGIQWVAGQTGTTPVEVLGVVTFYPMFRQQPAGRRQVRVCRTLSCALRGAYHTMEALEKAFGCQRGGTSADGDISLEFVECIASCGTGPVVQVDHALHEGVTPDKAEELAAAVRASLGDAAYGKAPPVPGTPGWNG
ncbi:MAG: NAD(P)H-dependent oxidoreductase subunit E [Puniceicoccales bacterium]|nr:NAD(P)H-dependent oxidoreductase subunit E [Puniceicoccales bacterium]